MNKEFKKMQKLAGLITKSEYKKNVNENQNDFDIIDRIISQNDFSITDYESLEDEMDHSDLVDAVADEMGGDFTRARQALEAWGMKKFGGEMASLDQEVYMDFLNELFDALGNGANAYSESTWTNQEEELVGAISRAISAANIDIA